MSSENKVIITITANSIERKVIIADKEFKDKTVREDDMWVTQGEDGICIETHLENMIEHNPEMEELSVSLDSISNIRIMEALEQLED